MKNVFKIITFYRFFRVKKFKEFLDKLRSNIDFETSDFNAFVYDEL